MYQQIAKQKRRELAPIDEHTVFDMKWFGNDIELLSCFKELFFNSRELLDYLLVELNRLTSETKNPTNKKFTKFAEPLMAGKYDTHNLPMLQFFKKNFTDIFMIRKVRNLIKESPRDIEFRYDTGRFEAFFFTPVIEDDKKLIKYLNIAGKDEILQNMKISYTFHLDGLFPSMDEFWSQCLALRKADTKSLPKK